MIREDLRKRIIPNTLKNKDKYKPGRAKDFETTDLIYIDSYEEQCELKKKDKLRRISATDFAKLNYVQVYDRWKNSTGKPAAAIWLRSECTPDSVYGINAIGDFQVFLLDNLCGLGVCPSLRYKIPKDSKRSWDEIFSRENQSEENFDVNIQEVKDIYGISLYHVLLLGEYPKTIVNKNLNGVLEELYNRGNIKDELFCTGRWYSKNGQEKVNRGYIGMHCPEFEYKGKRYIRMLLHRNIGDYKGNIDLKRSGLEKETSVVWVEVEPIPFIIRNWKEMPKRINPERKW